MGVGFLKFSQPRGRYGTETSEGYISHKAVRSAAGVFYAPVKLQPTRPGHLALRRTLDRDVYRPVPLRRDGRLVYALPNHQELLV